MAKSIDFFKQKFLVAGFVALILLMAGFAVATIWFAPLQAFRIVFGTFFTIFLPGFVMSFVFFPNTVSLTRFEDDQGHEEDGLPALDWVERMTLSFALSLSAVPLAIYTTNRLGLPITVASVFGITLAIILISLFAIILRSKQR